MTDRITADILVEAFDLALPDFDDLKDRIEEAAAAHKATLTVDGRRYPAAATPVPPPADRAAYAQGIRDAIAELERDAFGAIPRLRRLAAEAQQQPDTEPPETEAVSHATLVELVRDFLDPDPCSFDHHGYCQAHAAGFGGEPLSCPHGRARKALAVIDGAGVRQDGAQSP